MTGAVRIILALCAAAAPAMAAPLPGEGEGDDPAWRFAVCETEAICRIQSQRCGQIPALGEMYLWRDGSELRAGTSARAARPVFAFANLEEVQAAQPGDGSVLVIPPDGYGAGWLRLAFLRISNGEIDDQFQRMFCETSTEVPPEPAPRLAPPQTGPEVPDQ
ncbi:MAG: hypothetical protein AAGF88_08845 [Pseudomonadota bacterium]